MTKPVDKTKWEEGRREDGTDGSVEDGKTSICLRH
jgi:hypothetical protein